MYKETIRKLFRFTPGQYDKVLGLAEVFDASEVETVRRCISIVDAIVNNKAKIVPNEDGSNTIVIL